MGLPDDAQARILGGIGLQDRHAAIGGTIIDRDHLHVHRGIAQQRIQLVGKIPLAVIDGDDQADLWRNGVDVVHIR